MKNLARFAAVAIILGLLAGLAAVPAMAQTPVVSVDVPLGDTGACVALDSSFTARISITYVTDYAASSFHVTYDPLVLQLTGVSDGYIDTQVTNAVFSWVGGIDSGHVIVLSGLPVNVLQVSGAGYLADIHFSVIGAAGSSSSIALSNGQIADGSIEEIPATWLGGSVDVCAPFSPVLTSGTYEAPGALSTGDVAGAIPPGFTPGDEFAPGDTVWVWGEGFLPSQQYNLWVQAYAAGSVVAEGHSLSGGPIAPVPVTTDGSGTFGTPVALWTTSGGNADTYWEIVADQVGTGQGTYNAADDGLDAIALDAYGFHVVPEALTIVLLAVGLVGLGGYYGLKRRRSSEGDA